MKKKLMIAILTTALAAGMISGCGNKGAVEAVPETGETEAMEEEYPEEAEENVEEAEVEEDQDSEEEGMSEETMNAALTGDGAITAFIGEPFYDGVIKNEDDALEALYSVVESIGGDSSTEFVYEVVDQTEDGIDYYTFRQAVGDITVYGAAAKVIADKNGKAIGLVSSIIPDLKAPSFEKWAVDAAQAEDIVRSAFEGQDVRLYTEATEQTLIPIVEGTEKYMYVWVVYSDNNFDDDNTDAAYAAHYVSYDGEYLQSIPVSDIGSNEALSGSVATFAFTNMESDTWSGTVKTLKGKNKKIEVPIMRDPATGTEYLGDTKRKILCADYSDFEYEETLTPLEAANGKWEDEAMITYYNFINIYDLYETTGWTGPDAKETPSLLLMDAKNENGEPLENAYYMGCKRGFQVFAFDTNDAYGEATDIVGHEFTHCVTSTLMTSNLYLNDYGAINEAMSDILGNLAAMMTDEEDEPYIIGENYSDTALRSMKEPNKFNQPAFVWDKYYVPIVAEGNEQNDNGGVHTNSSLLNYISYKISSAGMEPEDEFYYWTNVCRAMTPRTDYQQIAEILPWVMKTFGEDDYVSVVESAVKETGIESDELPETPAEGLAYVSIDIPESEYFTEKDVSAAISGFDGATYTSWPKAGTNRITLAIPGGKYFVVVSATSDEDEERTFYLYRDGEWEFVNEPGLDDWMMNTDGSDFMEVTAGDDLVIELEEEQ